MKKPFLVFLIIIVLGILFWMFFLRDVNVTGGANLSWNPSTEANISGYRIYYGTEKRSGDCPATGGYAKKVDVGKHTSYQLNNLQDKAIYYFSVTSYDTNGKESCFSEEMKKNINISLWDRLKNVFSGK
jgi:hypothetical protein